MQLIAESWDVLRRGLGHVGRRDRGRLRRVESRPARVVPRRAHRAGLPRRPIPKPGSRSSTWCSTRPARRAPARWTDAGRARSRRVGADDRRRARRARHVESQGPAGRGVRLAEGAGSGRAGVRRRRSHPGDRRSRGCALRGAHLRLRAGHGPDSGRRREVRLDHRSRARSARIWKGGCIIRAQLLDPVRNAFKADAGSGQPAPRSGDWRSRRVGAGRLAADGGAHRGQRHPDAGARLGARATSTAIARRGCRRASPRRSAMRSARTPTSGSTGRARCTATGKPTFTRAAASDPGAPPPPRTSMASLNLASVLEHTARLTPDRQAITFGQSHLTYAPARHTGGARRGRPGRSGHRAGRSRRALVPQPAVLSDRLLRHPQGRRGRRAAERAAQAARDRLSPARQRCARADRLRRDAGAPDRRDGPRRVRRDRLPAPGDHHRQSGRSDDGLAGADPRPDHAPALRLRSRRATGAPTTPR